jgi:SAM-dependent methyltransferase
VIDFGSGKGYLTFALHDYLHTVLRMEAKVTGVELRESLVDLCNATAVKMGCKGLYFLCGDVETYAPEFCDVMIALHACDTATDYAIHYGIRSQASIIMCSPCCHKQIRTQMHIPELLKPMLQYGVHLGQEAEMVTDTLRALLLEANGYSTKVFEFVSTEHTDKNKMILALKRRSGDKNSVLSQQALEHITALKKFYAIREHCLESLLQKN